jgi:hypothetical protein
MSHNHTKPFPCGFIINELYEIISPLKTTDTAITYLASHRTRGIKVHLTVLKADAGKEAFQAFMKRTREEHRTNTNILDFGVLLDGLVPYAVHATGQSIQPQQPLEGGD